MSADPLYLGTNGYFGLVTTATGTTLGAIKIQSLKYSREADSVQFKDEQGQTLGYTFTDKRKVLAIEALFAAAGIGALKTALAKVPCPGDVVTIADTHDATMFDLHAGAYLVLKAEKQKSNTEYARLSMEIVAHDGADVTTAFGA